MNIANEQLVNDALLESYSASSSFCEDFEIVKNTTEADSLDGILCLNSDSEYEPTAVEIYAALPALNIIEDSGDDLDEILNEPSTSTGKKKVTRLLGNETSRKKIESKVQNLLVVVIKK